VGKQTLPAEGQTTVVVDAETGEEADPVLVDGRSGRVLRGPEFKVATVPTAGAPNARRAKHTKVRTSS